MRLAETTELQKHSLPSYCSNFAFAKLAVKLDWEKVTVSAVIITTVKILLLLFILDLLSVGNLVQSAQVGNSFHYPSELVRYRVCQKMNSVFCSFFWNTTGNFDGKELFQVCSLVYILLIVWFWIQLCAWWLTFFNKNCKTSSQNLLKESDFC